MITLTKEDVAEFQQLAGEEGAILTVEEAQEAAKRLLLVYEILSRPTPKEIERRERRERTERSMQLLKDASTPICELKRGRGRV
jgi:hypothetical protein